MIKSDGGATSYYELPEGAKELNDLIEHKNMSFALGNIFKACYRFGEKDSADRLYDLNKIIFFTNRLIRIEQGQTGKAPKSKQPRTKVREWVDSMTPVGTEQLRDGGH